MPLSDNASSRFAAWLQERSNAISDYERQAHYALYDNTNESEYRELMKKKALLLAAIAKDAASLMNSLPEQDRGRVQKTLKAFSHNAQTALNLNSVFYMSALLYPDDHQKGEPNTLQKLIASL